MKRFLCSVVVVVLTGCPSGPQAGSGGGGGSSAGGGGSSTGAGGSATNGGGSATNGGGTATGGGSSGFAAGAVFLDNTSQGANAREPTVLVDSAGVAHAVYSGFTANVAGVYPIRYGRCASGCERSGSWAWVTLGDAGLFGGSGHLALGPDGHPHVAWLEQAAIDSTATLRYATCASNCALADTSWQVGTIVTAPGPNVSVPQPLIGRALTVDARGHPRLVIRRETSAPTGTFVAQCDSNCLTEGSWALTPLNGDSPSSGTLLAVGTGLRLLSNPRGTLNWQECASNCTSPSSWTGTDLFYAPTKYIAVALDAQARPRVAFNLGGLGEVALQHFSFYGWCDQGCTNVANWTNAQLPLAQGDGEEGLALAIDAQGTPGVAYTTLTGLGVAVCSAGCNTSGASWVTAEIETDTTVSAGATAPLPVNCNTGSTPKAWWYPGRGVQVALDADGNMRLVHETYVLQQCGGGTVRESIRLPRYTQL